MSHHVISNIQLLWLTKLFLSISCYYPNITEPTTENISEEVNYLSIWFKSL